MSGPGDAAEARSRQRFIAIPPLEGRFGRTLMVVYNLGEGGVQIEHSDPLKLGTVAELIIQLPQKTETAHFRARVVWSRLSKTPDAKGKFLYRSGIRVDEDEATAGEFLRRIILAFARPDFGSLERKRQAQAERAKHLAQTPALIVQHHAQAKSQADEAFLIQQAWERLRTHPEEAMKWYNRARFTKVEKGLDELPPHHRDDILAVWEYLERSFELSTIVRVFNSIPRK
jgi:hypothetical protein